MKTPVPVLGTRHGVGTLSKRTDDPECARAGEANVAAPALVASLESGSSLKLFRPASVVRVGGNRLERVHDALSAQLVCNQPDDG